MTTKDAFDQWQEWANRPADSDLSIPGDLHGAVMALEPDNRSDRKKVNQAVAVALDRNAETIWFYESGERFERFKTEAQGEAWLKENDPAGVLWKGRRGPPIPAGSADQYDVPRATE
jgi:hypothetical protein